MAKCRGNRQKFKKKRRRFFFFFFFLVFITLCESVSLYISSSFASSLLFSFFCVPCVHPPWWMDKDPGRGWLYSARYYNGAALFPSQGINSQQQRRRRREWKALYTYYFFLLFVRYFFQQRKVRCCVLHQDLHFWRFPFFSSLSPFSPQWRRFGRCAPLILPDVVSPFCCCCCCCYFRNDYAKIPAIAKATLSFFLSTNFLHRFPFHFYWRKEKKLITLEKSTPFFSHLDVVVAVVVVRLRYYLCICTKPGEITRGVASSSHDNGGSAGVRDELLLEQAATAIAAADPSSTDDGQGIIQWCTHAIVCIYIKTK